MRFGDIFFRDFVRVKGTWYMLDMRFTPDAGNECMAFLCARPGEPRNGNDVWSQRGMPLTEQAFKACRKEFIAYMQNRA